MRPSNPEDDFNYRRKTQETNYKLWFTAAIVLLALVSGGYYYFTQPTAQYALSRNVIVRLDENTRTVIARLNQEPCNQALANRLSNYLLNKAEYAAVISFINYTNKKCGENQDLMPTLFYAQKGSSDFVAAETTATRMVEQYPVSPYAYAWRAEARQQRKNYKGAYEDLKKTVYLVPDPSRVVSQVFYDMADMAAKSGQPCEAVATMRDYVAFNHIQRNTPQTKELIAQWREQGKCPDPYGKGSVRVRYNPRATSIVLPVEINGVQTRMVVDTGASHTLLTQSLAKRAGVTPLAHERTIAITANGLALTMGGRADYIALDKAKTQNVPVFIQTTDSAGFGDGAEGLLGLSFLGNYNFSLNNGVLELKPLD